MIDSSVKRASWQTAVLIFIILRLFLSIWAIVVQSIIPISNEPNEQIRPYLNQPILTDGPAGRLLGPWQRFDGLRYTRIAAEGYANEEDSVFPPLYPWLIRAVGFVLGGQHRHILVAAILISNAATVGLFVLLYRLTAVTLSPQMATRAVLYLALFPTGFFLLAPYTESLFLLFALGAMWAGLNGRLPLAGVLGMLAALTRLTGAVLCIPLFLIWWQSLGHAVWPPQTAISQLKKMGVQSRQWLYAGFALLPLAGSGLFLLYRSWLGLRPLPDIYQEYWFQTSDFPGYDVFRALQTMFFGGQSRAGEFTLWFDFIVTLFLIVTTVLVFKKFGAIWGSYNLLLLLFILLPTSEFKPLYSFSRYALTFIPTFMLMAEWGERPFINRIILYTSFPLYLYFSGQFFLWGWVA